MTRTDTGTRFAPDPDSDAPPGPTAVDDDPFDALEPFWIEDPTVIPSTRWHERAWVRRAGPVLVGLVVVGGLGVLVVALLSGETRPDRSGITTEVRGISEDNPDPPAAPPVATPVLEPTAVPTPAPSPTTSPTNVLYKTVADAGMALQGLEQVERLAPATSYVDYLADGWGDRDGDCIETPDEVLAATSIEPVGWSPNGCTVESGRWLDTWSGLEITDVADAAVTHVVPLPHAHAAGAWRWDRNAVAGFVNDNHPYALQVMSTVTAATIDPEGIALWRPAREAAWCSYALDWITTKTRWRLEITAAEHEALGEMLSTCFADTSDGPRPDQLSS